MVGLLNIVGYFTFRSR